jgi:acetyl/propionyl-CoA carboxylase alpha subunit
VRLDATVGSRTIRVEVRRVNDGYTVALDGSLLEVDVVETGNHFASLLIDGQSHDIGLERHTGGYRVHFPDDSITVGLVEASRDGSRPRRRPDGPARLNAPMPGRVVRVLAGVGQEVEPGQGLVVIEAMKMENELKSPRKGLVHEIAVREGQAVEAGALLVVVA